MQKGNAGEEAKKPATQAQVPGSSTQLTAGQVQSLARLKKGQPTAIVVTSSGSGANLSTFLTVPQALSGQSSATTAVCLANTRIISPQAINIIQRQIPSSGVVGLSCVTAEGLQQVLQGTPLTLVTAASPQAAAVLEQQRKQSLLQQQRRQPHQQSGATIHHLGPRGLANPISNQNVSLVATMSNIKQLTGDSQPATLSSSSNLNSVTSKDVKPQLSTAVSLTRGASTPITGGPSPKKIKLEEKLTSNNRTTSLRQSISNHKRSKMRDVKSKYRDHLTELFYLQAGGNMVEFQNWRKRPTQPLLQFLEGSKLDSDDEDDRIQEKRINDEVKVLTSSGSNIPVATPVAIATTLPPSVSALSQQGSSHILASPFSITNPKFTASTGIDDFLRQLSAYVKAMHSSSVTSLVTSTSITSTSSELQQHLTKNGDARSSHAHKGSSQSNQPIAAKSIKSQGTSPGRSRQAIASVYENVTGSPDVIVERAKQEAQVIQRVNELRKEGLWSAKRLPRVQEPPRQKAHWDYLLEEMTWLAADFIQERKWKKATSRKIARMISNHFREKEMKEMKAEKEEAIKLKKIASQMAKMVKEFWNNIEKVVQYKQTTRLEEKKKKALDLHLSFIVDQTEKYSSWLTAGLQSDNNMSKASSLDSDGSDAGDVEFQPVGTASDDEETIEKEENEAGSDGDGTKEELEALKKESELPIEDLLKSLPKEMLDMPSSGLDIEEDGPKEGESQSAGVKEKDGDFDVAGEDDCDEEETLDEQETHEKDYTEELDDLKAEGEMSVEELMKKYAGAYESDFEMPEEESSDDADGSTDGDEETSDSEKETGESEDEDDDEDMDGDEKSDETGLDAAKEAVGLEFLVKEEGVEPQPEQKTENGPGKEFNDIAAEAQSLQPKGYTLETTEVKTKVPFLLKHTLREYQHVGLDWLATMHEKRLNGILADEMGLGKTIQTIALLAHLACEKGTWGPHLIVVPTSVMLNWEMEIKKWCPAFKILTYYGSIKERKLKRQGWTKTNAFHVCITSYKLVVQDHQAFRRKKWKYFILDEAQNIKNFKSQRWQMLLNFSSQRRLLLTGTPLQNSLMELWSLMHFLMPNVFQSHSEFKEWFSNPLTGMIEGSQEYNESLVRRLHKVLRPFLLRRLKNEVEKQMPQKFEHVVMCRLSKRQRFLYDDFMSQSKTRETLASGHFMSVINILMQLRKVCNHPNLFDPRPVISPFKMEGIVYRTASLVANALSYDPFRDINIYSLYPSLADMETDLPSFVAERVKRLQAPRKLIEEIDSWPAPEPRPPPGQLKNLKLISSAALQPADSISSGTLHSRASSSSTIKATVAPTVQVSQTSQSSTMNNIKLLLPSSSSPSAQQSILIPNPNGSGPPIILPLPTSNTTSGASSVSSTSAAIAQAKLISSQLQSGLLHLVQTSSGHQVITVASTSTSSSTSSNPITTSMSSSTSSLSSTPSLSSSSNVSVLKISSSSGSHDKPVMKVTPFVVSSSTDAGSSTTTPALSKRTVSVDSTTVSKLLGSQLDRLPKKPVNKSELFLESLYRKKEERRRHILSHMAKLNQQKCSASPVMGPDTRSHLQCFQQLNCLNCNPSSNSSCKPTKPKAGASFKWTGGEGYANCLFAQDRTINHNHPNIFWRECCHLVNAVRSPEDHIKELHNILHRFVFVTPPVISPNIKIHTSHPNHSTDVKMEWCESHLKPFIHQNSANLHPIQLRTLVQFPEPRLIQYDCGKLQTMDILLRKLKSGQHRVLIFTQMTKMLDVLEAFLNFHGHRYLRLDGTTKVEQRQFLMDRFNADPRIFCFILSTRSGGIGVNLTGADTVIFYDSDWNPTMDAQAQDRCHRIGQTRDVHIYRLVSEMTVEENILKKANQKRLLGDLAIEGGNFTTAFFKQQTISDLFAEPSGLQSLVEAKEERMARRKTESMETDSPAQPPPKTESTKKETGSKKEEAKKESVVLTQFEQALSKAEDETDAQAVKQVQAEQKAELAEFDENIPWDEREAELRKEEDEFSKVEMELAMLDKELTPIERYAVLVVEAQTETETAEELKMAEEDIQNSKKDWELARLKALKEEEERKAELEEDEMLYIYQKDESQVKKKGKLGKKGQNKRGPKPKSNNSVSESEGDEAMSPNRRARDRQQQLSPKISPPNKNFVKTVKTTTKAVDKSGKPQKGKVGRGRPRKSEVEGSPPKQSGTSKSKIKINGSVLQNGPKGKIKKDKKECIDGEAVTGKKQPKVKQLVTSKQNKEGKEPGIKITKAEEKVKVTKEKKEKPITTIKTPLVSLVNGHSPQLTSKLNTQARNALLKKQALEAGHINIAKANDQILKSPPVATAAASLGSPQLRMPIKPSTPKSPIDPNIPPPWSNPNLVIRTRKAAVHSPVVLTRVQNPVQASPTNSVLQQSLTRLPAGLAVSASGVRIQGTGGDRNIFQLFNSNTAGIRLAGPTIRQVTSGQVVNQIQGATLLNPASLVNSVNLSNARFITAGVAGTPSSIIATGTKASTAINIGGTGSANIALVPTVLNPGGRGQTTILTQQGANALATAVVNQPGGETRTIMNATRLGSPITLQGVGGVPVAVNLIKTNTGIATVPIRHQQIIQASSLASLSGAGGQSAGYVFITPRPRITTSSSGGVATVQAVSSATNPNLQNARLILAQMPSGATVIQQPRTATVVNGVPIPTAAVPAAPTTPKKDNT